MEMEPRRTPTDHLHGTWRHDHPRGDEEHDHIAQHPGIMQVQPKSPASALVISFLLPGVGSMYAGGTPVGVVILITWIIGLALTILIIGIPIVVGAWIWGMIHAYQSAVRWNRDHGIIS